MIYTRGQQTFPVEGQIEVNTLGFASHMVSVATTQLCCCNTKAAIDYGNK